MKSITQEDLCGCSIACVAFILGIKYANAKRLFADGEKAKDKGFYCREIVSALKRKGLQYNFKYIKSYLKNKIYQPFTIVYIAKSKNYPIGHYLCRTPDKRWMDPSINLPKLQAKSGFRKRLPGRPIYAILKE